MRPYRVGEVPPFDGHHWHAHYHRDGHWHEVRDELGKVIVYATARLANDAAKTALLAPPADTATRRRLVYCSKCAKSMGWHFLPVDALDVQCFDCGERNGRVG